VCRFTSRTGRRKQNADAALKGVCQKQGAGCGHRDRFNAIAAQASATPTANVVLGYPPLPINPKASAFCFS
jgi:hypothetical protein